MTHRDGLPRLSGDAVRKPWETAVPVAQANRQRANRCGRRKASTMSRRTRGFPPTRPMARWIARAISMGHYQRSLVLGEQPARSLAETGFRTPPGAPDDDGRGVLTIA